jgi:hypothetical protein
MPDRETLYGIQMEILEILCIKSASDAVKRLRKLAKGFNQPGMFRYARHRSMTARAAEQALKLHEKNKLGYGARTDLYGMRRVDSFTESAKVYGVSVGSMSCMKKVLNFCDHETIGKVRRGEISLQAGKNLADQIEAEQIEKESEESNG